MIKLTQTQMKEINKVAGYNNIFSNNNQLETVVEEKTPTTATI